MADLQHVQRPAALEPSAPIGHELVEPGVAGVLGFVDISSAGIDHDRFVGEAAHVDQRRRVAGLDTDFKIPPVPWVDRFLARDPRAPRRHAAGAIANGPGEGGVRGEPPAFPGVEHQIGRAAGAIGRVSDFRTADVRRASSRLVISHEHQPAGSAAIVVSIVVVIAPAGAVTVAVPSIVVVIVVVAMQLVDHGHPVVEARARHAVRHHVAGPAVRPVAEAPRQLDQRQAGRLVQHRSDRPIRTRAVGARRAFGAPGHEPVERQRPERAGPHGATAEECPPVGRIDVGHLSSFSDSCPRRAGGRSEKGKYRRDVKRSRRGCNASVSCS